VKKYKGKWFINSCHKTQTEAIKKLEKEFGTKDYRFTSSAGEENFRIIINTYFRGMFKEYNNSQYAKNSIATNFFDF
jgi:hypothetical protein